jgi:MEDS: MEthanogen/methylotroph, DcmR Sensory domain
MQATHALTCLPTVSSNPPLANSPGYHAVRFYNDSAGLCRIVGSFLVEGLEQGQSAIIIATLPHAAAIYRHLSASGYDTTALERSGKLQPFDAKETLDRLMVNDVPDVHRLRELMLPVLDQACAGGTTVRIYGEMVDLLWQAEQPAAATRLEMYWNTLSTARPLSILCGYSLTRFRNSAAVNEICALHSHVVDERGSATPAH